MQDTFHNTKNIQYLLLSIPLLRYSRTIFLSSGLFMNQPIRTLDSDPGFSPPNFSFEFLENSAVSQDKTDYSYFLISP